MLDPLQTDYLQLDQLITDIKRRKNQAIDNYIEFLKTAYPKVGIDYHENKSPPSAVLYLDRTPEITANVQAYYLDQILPYWLSLNNRQNLLLQFRDKPLDDVTIGLMNGVLRSAEQSAKQLGIKPLCQIAETFLTPVKSPI